MGLYLYTAKPEPDKTIQGQIEAESEQEAVNKIVEMGYFPVSVRSQDTPSGKDSALGMRKFSSKDVTLFTSQLSSLINAGVNILNSLGIISSQTPNKYLESIIKEVSAKIRDGKPLSDSLADYPDVFPGLYTSMVRTGEASGRIDQALARLSGFMEKEEEFKNSLRSALTYPAFVLVVSILTVGVLLGFVIPKLAGMFEDMGQALPLPTKILINTSNFLRAYWWLAAAVIAVAVFLFIRFSNNSRTRARIDEIKLKLPVWGVIILKTEISRMMRTLSLLISSGMTIGPSLDIAASVLTSQVIKDEAIKFKDEINKGGRLSDTFRESKYFPEFTINIISIGEETGALDKAFMSIANDYEKDADARLKAFARLLEPVVILVMGLIVGFIVISMLLPIFQINLIVK